MYYTSHEVSIQVMILKGIKMKLITKLRLKQGLSQSALAHKANIHPSSLSRIELGKESLRGVRAYRLAEALGWPREPEELFKEVDEGE